jgi:hypothetical protein
MYKSLEEYNHYEDFYEPLNDGRLGIIPIMQDSFTFMMLPASRSASDKFTYNIFHVYPNTKTKKIEVYKNNEGIISNLLFLMYLHKAVPWHKNIDYWVEMVDVEDIADHIERSIEAAMWRVSL